MPVQYMLRFLDKRFYIALQSGITVEVSLAEILNRLAQEQGDGFVSRNVSERAGSFRLSLIYRDVSCPPQLPRQALCPITPILYYAPPAPP